MSVPKGKLVTVEIGSSWTRVFVIDHEKENRLKILSSASLPTSVGDLKFAVQNLFEKLDITPKEHSLIWTSSLDEATSVTEDFKGIFVPFGEVKKNLSAWLRSEGYPSCTVLDAGAGLMRSSFKAAEVGSFLTFAIGESELENHLANLSLHPQTVPETKNEMEIAESLMRVSFAKKAAELGEASNILVTGSLVAAHPNLARIALVVLDVLGEGKVAEVVVDKGSFGNCWGAALTKYRELAGFEIDFLEKLGTFVSLGGTGRVELDYGLKNLQEVTADQNEIALIPAGSGQKVKISFGLGKEKRKFEASGGSFGILIDARPKPLALVFGSASSQHAMLSWREALEKVELIK
ncbi:MAG: hypothetical protein A3F35_00355 [Candidatus Woykebacteria bacterium RIFCSPHIGHO2_12_FULL_45_10]|uniref:Uncharacterized protein n=1 Tax=Candidatus Woykebacteria bacterium RIFCSPHIGHO2_12_FULL_45_10 TaxID=1802603 RepID=A0A1G1WRA8_9BACT|nr:MAG: hypothetical protein A3F35_00355 [Candidatus Woykebacteria bacterium RIFCSPHIGHO2_12_FULL_45_10]